MPLKAVFFDFYGTLVRFHPPREWIQTQAARAFGLELHREGLAFGYAEADEFMTRENAQGHVGNRTPAERAAFFARYEQLILRAAIGKEVALELAGQVWERVFVTPSEMGAFPDVLPTLQVLKRRALLLGVISNAPRDLLPDCRRIGIDSYLSVIMTSKVAGAEKPSARIFLAALAAAHVDAAEAVMVGDQYEGDILGARAAQVRAILIDRDGSYERYRDVERLAVLTELPALLAS